MTNVDFAAKVDTINSLLGTGSPFHILYQDVVRADGKHPAYILRSDDRPASPIVYKEDIDTMSDGKIADYLREIYANSQVDLDGCDMSNITDRGYVLSHVRPRLANNKFESVYADEGILFDRFLDLIVTYYVPMTIGVQFGSYTIRREHLKNTGICADELRHAAHSNMESDLYIQPMSTVISDMTGCDMGNDESSIPMMIASTGEAMEQGSYGASVLLSSAAMAKTARQLYTDSIYILPSSTHEVIAIPSSLGDSDSLREMVREINDTIVSDNPRDVLSDTVYRYDTHSNMVTIAE